MTRASGYLLDLEPDHVDALQFARLVTDGRRGLEDHASDKVAAAFRRALALWRGAPLVEFLNHDWARQEAARLEELYLDALEDRIQADLAMGLHADLVNELQGLVREHSFRERLWGQLMLALYRCGRQTDALAAFHEVRRVLADGNGLDPGPELERLELAILAHDPELAVAARPVAPAAAYQPVPSSLPTPLTSFIGRHDQVLVIRALLDECRLVTLTGPPGVGKTRLAIEVGLRRPSPSAAAEASLPADVLACLRSRRGLLIFDNCEHVARSSACACEKLPQSDSRAVRRLRARHSGARARARVGNGLG